MDQPLSHLISADAVVSAELLACAAALRTKLAPGQRLEGGGDGAVGVEIMRPGEASAQSEDAILHAE